MADHLAGIPHTIKRVTIRRDGDPKKGGACAHWVGQVEAPWSDCGEMITRLGRNRREARRLLNRSYGKSRRECDFGPLRQAVTSAYLATASKMGKIKNSAITTDKLSMASVTEAKL